MGFECDASDKKEMWHVVASPTSSATTAPASAATATAPANTTSTSIS